MPKLSDHENGGSWVGSRLPILPHESTPSVQLRVGFSNGYTQADVRRHFGVGRGTRSDPVPMPQGSVALGLPAPSDEIGVMDALGIMRSVLFDGRFKFCPDCTAGGYHSFWFQLRGLEVCPLHDSRLRNSCASCQCPSPEWKQAITCMDYLCPACAEPITGELVQYHELLARRPCADSLERVFSPYRKWALSLVTNGNSGAPELCAIVRDYAAFLDYDEMAFDIIRQNSAMLGDMGFGPKKVRVIGQVASDLSALVPAENNRMSIDDALREDAFTCAKISRQALGLIAENCLNEEQLSLAKEVRRSLVHSEPIDIGAYDADAMAFAMVDEYFDTKRAPFHARKKWVPSPCGLGYVDEPRFHSVRRLPRTWMCVILAAYGITREVVRVLMGGGQKRERIQLYCTWKLSEGGMIRLNRDVLRQFYLATLPVIFVQPEVVIDPRQIHGACVIAPQFPGLDAIIIDERLATFSDLLQARALATKSR